MRGGLLAWLRRTRWEGRTGKGTAGDKDKRRLAGFCLAVLELLLWKGVGL